MCKVCRLWGVLSLALFSYACRPNFHHKHLALYDPLLSVCGEALISLHTWADRARNPYVGAMYECVFSCVCVYVYIKEMCVCRQLCMCVATQHRLQCSSYSAIPFPLYLVCSSPQGDTVHFRNLYWKVRGQTPFCLSSIPPLFQLPPFISRRSDEENEAKQPLGTVR